MKGQVRPVGFARNQAARSASRFPRPAEGLGVKRISVEFERGPTAAAAARNALLALEHRLDPAVLDDLRLLVSELVTNSVRHAEDHGAGSVGMLVTIDGHTMRVEVTDGGSGFDPKPREPGQTKASGWGLYLVDRLADRWGVVHDALTNVWFEIDGAARSAA